MSFHNSTAERLPPIITSGSHSTNNIAPTPVLPPVSCLAPPVPSLMTPITPPADFTTPPHTSANGHFHFHHDTPQPFSPSPTRGSAPQQLPHIPPSHHGMGPTPMHHHYAHSIYHQARPIVDPASELLAEKRRRNAGASARFRDRRKQREREMQEKCQFLERRVQELENMDSAKHITELKKKLELANEERNSSNQKILELEKEVQQLRSRLCEREVEFLTPPSSTGEYDSKDMFDSISRLSRSPSASSTSSDHRRKPTDVKSLLS